MAGVNVRIPPEAFKPLQEIAVEQQTTVGNVIAEWVKQHEEEQYWARLRAQVAATMEDPQARAEIEAEQFDYDMALLDGLEDE